MTDTSGTVVWSAVYDSFGKATIDTETITNNLRFPGQYYDTETGLHYNWNRYYDPETGRYMRVDPVGEGLNLYLYTKNNPLRYVDPRGLEHISNNSDESQNYTNNQSPEPKTPSLQANNQQSNDSDDWEIMADGGSEEKPSKNWPLILDAAADGFTDGFLSGAYIGYGATGMNLVGGMVGALILGPIDALIMGYDEYMRQEKLLRIPGKESEEDGN